MKQTRRVPFDLEKAKQGAKVVTRNGYPVRLGLFDLKGKHSFPITGAIDKDGKEDVQFFTAEGKFSTLFDESDLDLFIEVEEEEEEVDNYNPYKETVKSIADMVERYSELQSLEELKDFYDNVKVKCREAIEYDKKLCKKQEEQKTSDSLKISPDKWYICIEMCNSTDIIGFAEGHYYLGSDILKNCLLGKNKDYKDLFRPWNFNDAKDGDVLCYETKDEFRIFIYKNGYVYFHCHYYNGHLTTVDSYFIIPKHLLCYIHPATKEQRELLFQKMKEEGYKWDSDKKELKKIVPKFKVGDVMRTLEEANDDITEGLPVVISIDDDYYHCNNETIAIKDQDEYEYPPMNAKQKEVKKRRMTNRKLADWLRKCPEEFREFTFNKEHDRVYSYHDYLESEADKPVYKDILIRRNHGEWEEPLVEF